MTLYILVDGEPLQVELEEWSAWMDEASVNDEPDRQPTRRIASWRSGDLWVSTVFLGIASDWREPLLFETMVFDGEEAIAQHRYATKAEAMAGHAEIVEHCRTTALPCLRQ
jgi:hypothetical protein